MITRHKIEIHSQAMRGYIIAFVSLNDQICNLLFIQ